MNRIIIFGCGGHAKSALDIVLQCESYKDIVFVDENARDNEKILGYPVLNDFVVAEEDDVFVAIGNAELRQELCSKYYNNLISLVSPSAYIATEVKLGKGVFVGNNAHIGIFSEVGDFSIVNTGASIDHNCEIGRASFLGPRAVLCGKVSIGDNVFIGAGTTVIDKVLIGSNVFIGAASLVIKNIDEQGLYFGSPVKKR